MPPLIKKAPVLFMLSIILSILMVQLYRRSSVSSHAAPLNPMGQDGEWVLLFQDEFDASALAADKWATCYWWGNDGCTISSNNELQWYQPENVLTQDGILRLQAKEESITGSTGETYDYTSGLVTTGKNSSDSAVPHHFIFQYGYAEIRARVPEGQGLWPAFWFLPADHISRPEIDVMEILGHDTQTQRMHFHYTDESQERISVGENWAAEAGFSADWHTFGLDWQPNAITWFVDGQEVWRYEDAQYIPDEPMYLLLNLAVGGDWPGAPDGSTEFPAEFLIDYVKVWRRRADPIVVPLVADTYITNEDPDENFGEATILSIDGDPQKIMLLQFDRSQLNFSAIQSATLRLYSGPDEGHDSLQTAVIYHVPDFEWHEEEIVYANSDIHFGEIVGEVLAPTTNTTYEVVLDTAILNANSEQKITLAIVSNRDDGLHLLSKENSFNIPRLIITPLDNNQYLPLVMIP